MKVPITVNIDHNKKMLFESIKAVHGKTFTDILDEAVTKCLNEIVPADIIEAKILEKEQELMQLRQDLAQARIVQQQVAVVQKESDETEEYLEKIRNEKFSNENLESITKLWNRGDLNWNALMNTYQFNNKNETRNWFMEKLREAGAI